MVYSREGYPSQTMSFLCSLNENGTNCEGNQRQNYQDKLFSTFSCNLRNKKKSSNLKTHFYTTCLSPYIFCASNSSLFSAQFLEGCSLPFLS